MVVVCDKLTVTRLKMNSIVVVDLDNVDSGQAMNISLGNLPVVSVLGMVC
jgi:hypothetical protein